MALYRYVTSKDDLVAIMVEAALSDVPLPDTPPQNWRHGLERAARRDWELYHRHPWILAKVLVTTRAHFSPALAADSESAFSSFDGLGLEPADAFRYMFMLASYVQGVALTYVSDVEAERQSANAARRKGTSPEAVRAPLFAPGAYPRLGPAMRAGADPWDLDALFLMRPCRSPRRHRGRSRPARPQGSSGLGPAIRLSGPTTPEPRRAPASFASQTRAREPGPASRHGAGLHPPSGPALASSIEIR